MSRTPPRSLLHALARPRFLLSPWPLRALLYAAATPVAALLWGPPLLLLALPWLLLIAAVADSPQGSLPPPGPTVLLIAVGTALLAGIGPFAALPGAALERLRVRFIDDRPLPGPHRAPRRPGLGAWIAARYTEGATWRGMAVLALSALLFLPLTAGVGMLLVIGAALVATPVIVAVDGGTVNLGVWEFDGLAHAWIPALAGVAVLAAGAYACGATAAAQGELVRFMQRDRPEETLRAELTEVTRSRARLVDAFEAERRRIERDLHDGAQQRLVALSVKLGLARLDLPEGSAARESLAEAQEQAKSALVELRELVRGIHPQVLTDRGLPGALPELADRCAVLAKLDLPPDDDVNRRVMAVLAYLRDA
ncbi:sensor histidine kinase [Nocardiopsis baichengensis]|uniref:sensor histidine kinase n=1 Tax=Nocardiopsis baichengensis TaxID=280240 RepID=UPI00034B067E|nr:histidine kinase [Nocardiopsis baichengensis]